MKQREEKTDGTRQIQTHKKQGRVDVYFTEHSEVNGDRWSSWRFTGRQGRPSAIGTPQGRRMSAELDWEGETTDSDTRGQERERDCADRDGCLFCWCTRERVCICAVPAGSDSAVCSVAV